MSYKYLNIIKNLNNKVSKTVLNQFLFNDSVIDKYNSLLFTIQIFFDVTYQKEN